MTKRKINNKKQYFTCKRCGRKTLFITTVGCKNVKYCNSCRNGLAENGTGDLIEFPCKNNDGTINFKQELYEIEKEMRNLGLKNKKKRKL